MKSSLKIGMIGFGNIGTGVVRALAQNEDILKGRLPQGMELARITDVDTQTHRDAPYDSALFSDDTDALLDDPEINVVVELTGTIEPARTFIERALKAGKHVVTANKALIALHGGELIRIAVDNDVCLLFEAAVGGGIPVIRTMHNGLASNDIVAVRGIINGTANYILTRMGQDGLAFQEALDEAQELGYAEPDPTFDIEGHDTAHKLAILASLAFGQDVRFEDVYREGITNITAQDISYAAEIGYAIKLLGIAKRMGDGRIEARVHPTLLPDHGRLASVNGVFNAIRIDGNLTGSVILSGRGAGAEPTASAILSDLMVLASGKAEGGLRREMRLSLPFEEKAVAPIDDLSMCYCIRFGMLDVAGALAQVLTVLGKHGVSINSMKQPPESASHEYTNVMVTTQETQESNLQNAMQEIQKLDVIRTEPFVMRIEQMG
ncbi:MAG: homoserine dehydrogenase [Candidatus Sumerlaeota bacterium]